MKHIYRWGCGRTTSFALFLLVAGICLAAFHRLDASFVGLATIIQGLVTARAVADDHKPVRDKWTAEDRAAAAAQKGGPS